MNLKAYLENERKNLEKAIAQDQKFLLTTPPGSLIVKKHGTCCGWIHTNATNKKKNTYIKKTNRALAENLAAKGYVTSRLKDEKDELKAISLYLKNCPFDANRNRYLDKDEEYLQLLKPFIDSKDAIVIDWQNKKYIGTVPHPEQLKYKTQAGYKVRSKSEQIIVALLVKYGIPHKYEQCIHINGQDYYPDFMIMNPRTHQEYIWEHLGMMDNYKYREHNLEKIRDYALLGYYPGENLVLTYETDKSGFDEIWAEQVVNHFFL